jgi:transcription termination/antitermination protein NusG
VKTGIGTGDDSDESRNQFQPDATVRVIDGPFKESSGTVDAVDHERSTLLVDVSIFGRKTPIELTFQQLRPL